MLALGVRATAHGWQLALADAGRADATEPIALGAVSYIGAPAATPSSLKLTIASGSATTRDATLAVCPLETTSFSPAEGGAAADAPTYDCSTKITAAASGSAFT